MKKLFVGLSALVLFLTPIGLYAGSIQSGFNTSNFNATNTALNIASGAPADNFGRCDDCYLDTALPLSSLGFANNLNFQGFTLSQIYVNNNGNITFLQPLSTYTPFNLITTGTPIIAPYFADVDSRGAPNPPPVGVAAWGTGTYGGHQAFGVTWEQVGYYAAHEDKLNTFQVLLVDRSDTGAGNFDILFYYQQLQWETGDASGGSGGLGGFSARAGFSNGLNYALELPGSAINGALIDGGPDSLTAGSNMGMPGCWLWQVRNGQVVTPEPASLVMFGSGILAVAGVLRRKLFL